MTVNILILCTHNAARSILGEAMLNHLASRQGRDVRGFSAGSAPRGRVHPIAMEVLRDAGVDTRGLHSKSWDDFSTDGAPSLSAVITVCDSAAAETCPVFFGGAGQGSPVKVHWGYPDPSRVEGDEAAQRHAFDLTRQALGYRLQQLLAMPIETLDHADLQRALIDIGRS